MRRVIGAAGQGGFTLIEVLVAMTIVAVALMSALRATGSMLQSGEELRMRAMAQWSAENRLARIRVQNEWPAPGRSEADCSQAGLTLLCIEEIYPTPNPFFRRVEISVVDPRDRHRLARLVGFSVNLPQ